MTAGPAQAQTGRAGDPATMVVRDAAHLAPLQDEWRELAELAGNPYLTPEWFRTCLERDGVRPWVVVVRDGEGGLRGMLPLVGVRSAGLRWLRFPADDLGDTFTVLAAPSEDPGEIAWLAGRRLARERRAWDAIGLSYVDAAAPWVAGLVGGLGDVRVMERSRVVRPHVDLAQGWDALLAGMKRTNRKELRRRERRVLDAGGGFSQVDAGSPEAVANGIATLMRLHDARWSDRGGSSLGGEEPQRFLAAFAARAAERGWLRLWTLDMEGAPAAAELAWRIGPTQLHYQGGFATEWAHLGVGVVLFCHALQEGIRQGAQEADLGMGESDYKRRVTELDRTASLLVVMPARHPARPVVAGVLAARRALKEHLSEEWQGRIAKLVKRG